MISFKRTKSLLVLEQIVYLDYKEGNSKKTLKIKP